MPGSCGGASSYHQLPWPGLTARQSLWMGSIRVQAHKSEGHREIQAEVHEVTEQKARQMAALANTAHGLQLERPSKRRVFQTFVRGRGHYDPKTKTYLSYRELASALGGIASHTTLRNWMKQDFPKTFSKIGGGDARPADPFEEPERDPDEESFGWPWRDCERPSMPRGGSRTHNAGGTLSGPRRKPWGPSRMAGNGTQRSMRATSERGRYGPFKLNT